MRSKNNKPPRIRQLEGAVAQLRHAYLNLHRDGQQWGVRQRREFANGLIAPQIKTIEAILKELMLEDTHAR